MIKQARYARLVKFIRDTITSAGYTKASGKPNLKSFLEDFSPRLEAQGGKISYTTLRSLIQSPKNRPYGETLTSLAILLSIARGEAVTVAQLNDLIDVPAIDAMDAEVDPDDLPEDAEEIAAEQALQSIKGLSIDARRTIAADLLQLLSRDWAYLVAPPPERLAQLLQADLVRRGIGLERYAAEVLDNEIPLTALRSIYKGQKPSTDLTLVQILVLQEAIKSIDGADLTFEELSYLAPNLDRSET